MNKYIFSSLFYILGIGIITTLVFSPRKLQEDGPDAWNRYVQNIFFAWQRLVYCFGISLIAIPNLLSEQDYIVRFLGHKIWIFIARLSFVGYLYHFIILQVTANN